jgi:hypothetical protein
MPIDVDTSLLPLTIHTFSGEVVLEDLQHYLATLEGLLVAGNCFASIADFEQMRRMDRSLVKIHADWMKQHREVIKRQWLGVALVFRSPMVRFLLSSLLLLSNFPMPYKTAEVVDQAFPYAARWIEGSGQRLPAAALARVAAAAR